MKNIQKLSNFTTSLYTVYNYYGHCYAYHLIYKCWYLCKIYYIWMFRYLVDYYPWILQHVQPSKPKSASSSSKQESKSSKDKCTVMWRSEHTYQISNFTSVNFFLFVFACCKGNRTYRMLVYPNSHSFLLLINKLFMWTAQQNYISHGR